MADNVAITPGAGATVATDDVGGVQYQRVKVAVGADGSATDLAPGQTTMSASVPVVVASDQSAVNVTGTRLNDGSVTAAGKSHLTAGGTDGTNLRPMLVDSSGRPIVNINGSVTVSGALTDSQLRASPVPVSGTVTASGPVTDAQLRASAVPVTANAGTNLNTSALALETGGNLTTIAGRLPSAFGQQAAASSLSVALANEHILDQYITGQGSQTAINQNVILAVAGAGSTDSQQYRSFSISITPAAGTVTAGNITFEGSNDNSNFVAVPLYDATSPNNLPISTYALVAATTRYFSGPCMFRYVRARISTGVTGTTTGIQAFTILSMAPFVPFGATQVVNQTAANLNVTIGSGTVTTVTTVTTCTTLTNITNWGNIVDNAAFTDGTTRLSPNGYIFDEVAGTALTENDAAAARVDAKRAQVVVLEDATNRGRRVNYGLTIFRSISVVATGQNVKGSSGQVYGITVSNTNAAARYLKVYDKATAPTVGTDTPVMTIFLPPTTTLAPIELENGLFFTLGIGIGATTAVADADVGAPSANDVIVNMYYA